MHKLQNISPVDGRYQKQTSPLRKFFSEEALIRYRVYMEIQYLLNLADIIPQLKNLSEASKKQILGIATAFTHEDARRVKEIEKETNHDIKAVEYFIKEKFDAQGLGQYKEWVHFGLTSQDINNTAVPLSIKEALEQVIIPALEELVDQLKDLSEKWLDTPMLARTHGQPASPTTVGKEFMVFRERIQNQLEDLKKMPYPAKFGGATGNFNAHKAAYPGIDWIEFANRFVESNLKLIRSAVTTQIDHYDGLSAIFDCLKRISTIIIDLNRDLWSYISMDYFKQKITEGEVGSSAMPHKVNPIDFENSEGNCGIATALFEHLSAKLPISRLQRDLSDSTVIRNIGVPCAHMILAIKSTIKGLNKLVINKEKIDKDLENNWQVVAEAIQNILRREGYPKPYEKLKELTRVNKDIDKKAIHDFIDTLDISAEIKNEMKNITPFNYTGLLPKIK